METIKTYDTLYNTDNKGKIRIWYAEMKIEDDLAYIRNVSGIKDGKLVESGWKEMKPKNVGRANSTTSIEQGESEIQSLYDKQLAQGGYHTELEDAGQSKYIAPMLAQKYADVGKAIDYNQPVWTQPKLDGHRCIASQSAGLNTRKGKPFKSVPHIYEALYEVFSAFPGIILDGELYNHDLHDDFNELSSLVRKSKPDKDDLKRTEKFIQYHIYDIVDGTLNQYDRLTLLDRVFAVIPDTAFHKCLVKVPTTPVKSAEETDQMYGEYLAGLYEGQMIRTNDFYKVDQRPKCLIKRKEFFDEEGEILDIREGEGNWAGAAKVVDIRLADGIECSASIKGNKDQLTKLLADRHLYIGNGSQATIRFPNKTPGGKPRFPVAVDLCIGPRND